MTAGESADMIEHHRVVCTRENTDLKRLLDDLHFLISNQVGHHMLMCIHMFVFDTVPGSTDCRVITSPDNKYSSET